MPLPIYFCPQCTHVFSLPESLSDEACAHAGELVRSSQRVAAIMYIVNTSGEPPKLGLAETKTIVHHIPDKVNICHVCGNELYEKGIVHCLQCKAITLNW